MGRLDRRPSRRRLELGPQRFSVATDVRPRLLCRRDDAHRRPQIRHGQIRCRLPSIAASSRRDHCRRNSDEQDGSSLAQSLRSDARAQMGHQHGILRQRRRLLPLFLLGRPRMRQNHPSGHLRPGMSADRRGAPLWNPPAPEEGEAHEDRPDVVQKVNLRLVTKLVDNNMRGICF